MANAHHTAEQIRNLLHYDPQSGDFTWKRPRSKLFPFRQAGWIDSKGYRSIRLDRIHYKAHRLAWLYMTGNWPTLEIDHINRSKSDNRWLNLREVTSGQNAQNTKVNRDSSSGFKGVHLHKKTSKWRAGIGFKGKHIDLGLFSSKEAAICARMNAEKIYFTHSAFSPPIGNLGFLDQVDGTQ